MKELTIISPKYGPKTVLMDEDDYLKYGNLSWHVSFDKGKFYVKRTTRVGNKFPSFQLHREIMNVVNPRVQVDHVDGNPLNNQKNNLRVCDNQHNQFNQLPREASSKYKGVSRHKRSGGWAAVIGHNKKQINIGVFQNEADAAIAYNKKALELFGAFAKLNEV